MSNSASHLIPFIFDAYKNTYASSFEFYGDYAFAGLCNSGMVIRSSNRYSWEKFYQTGDTTVSAMKVHNGYLYIGTFPEGNVYRIDLSDYSSEILGNIGYEIVDFSELNGELYVAINNPVSILKLNEITDNFDFVYSPYAKVNEIKVINEFLYAVIESGNILYFDGVSWKKIVMNDLYTNVLSYRNISKEIYSHSNVSMINRSSVINTDGMTNEDILGIFPVNRSTGVNRICGDGSSIIIGSSNFTRVYRLLDDNIKIMFNTEGTSIDNMLNIDIGVNLVSSKNKIYLVHSGQINSDESDIETLPTPTEDESDIEIENVNEGKVVVLTYPNGGEIIQLGDVVNIQWSSTRGINDAVKIELVNDNDIITINNQISNSGQYFWEVPLSIEESPNYKIRITWLAAGSTDENNKDESDNVFSIVMTIPTTTTTTTLPQDSQKPDTTSNRGIPVLELPSYENIIKMVNDPLDNSILISTSEGRILRCSELVINGFLTGDRMVYADIYDGCGYHSSAQTAFNYSLYKKLAELDEDKVIQKWKYCSDITAIKTEKITAIFKGPVINIHNDFGFWKELIWDEIKPNGSEVTIFLRSATTEDGLLEQPWIYSTSSIIGESGTITRSLNNVGLKGNYLQIKIEMQVDVKDITPSVTNVTLKYSTKNSSYFFTNKFTIDLEDSAKKGLLTASISQPANTEIQFGISSENTVDWNKYQIITPDKFFDMDNKEFRVGIKFTSYDESLPVVNEFAILAGGEVLKGLNL